MKGVLKPQALVGLKLKVETSGANSSYKIRITSPVLARSVYLSFGNLEVKLSDNYFDLLPRETIEIAATSKASLDELRAQLKAVSLTDAFANGGQAASVTAASLKSPLKR